MRKTITFASRWRCHRKIQSKQTFQSLFWSCYNWEKVLEKLYVKLEAFLSKMSFCSKKSDCGNTNKKIFENGLFCTVLSGEEKSSPPRFFYFRYLHRSCHRQLVKLVVLLLFLQFVVSHSHISIAAAAEYWLNIALLLLNTKISNIVIFVRKNVSKNKIEHA